MLGPDCGNILIRPNSGDPVMFGLPANINRRISSPSEDEHDYPQVKPVDSSPSGDEYDLVDKKHE